MRKKKNFNLQDDYKINEIELQDAISTATKEVNKMRKKEF